MAIKRWKAGGCSFEVAPATRKSAAVWFVTRGERQKDGVANTTAEARRDAWDAGKDLGCPRRKYRRGR